MTNHNTESTINAVNQLLDDIKENIIEVNDRCVYNKLLYFDMYKKNKQTQATFFFILVQQIQLNTVKPTNLPDKKLLNCDENKDELPLLSSSNGSILESNESSTSLILMNKQIELIHPLEHQWSFWYLKNQHGKDWQDNLMKLATFDYVEEFWA